MVLLGDIGDHGDLFWGEIGFALMLCVHTWF
jgi:hypothetical protein